MRTPLREERPPRSEDKGSTRIGPGEVLELLRESRPPLLVDVRLQPSWARSRRQIAGAARIPADELAARHEELHRDRLVVTYCSSPDEATSARAALALREKGYQAKALLGGWRRWQGLGYPTEPKKQPREAPRVRATTARHYSGHG